jgi:hypothetical protein
MPDYWKNRVLYFASISEQHRDIKLRMRELIYRQVELLVHHFGYRDPIYPETVNLVSWPLGLEMFPHVDRDNGFDQRLFAAVAYLNDDYEGGEIYFPEINESIKPKAGMLVAFNCGPRHRHGVKPTGGNALRYTFPSWFTEREERLDRSLADYR